MQTKKKGKKKEEKMSCSHHRCGGLVAATSPIPHNAQVFEPIQAIGKQDTVVVHSAYLGPVKLRCTNLGQGYCALIYPMKSIDGKRNIYVKQINAAMYNLNPDVMYPLSVLFNYCQASVVNVNECKRHFDIIQCLRAKESLTRYEKNQLHKSLIHNNPVDIHFLTCLYVEFLQQRLGIDNILPDSNALISLHNVPRLDNAFFTGSYMIYGNGNTYFYPMGTIDIGGHELGHGVVQLLAGLIYNGHAGALNESFADMLGCAFEFYCYEISPELFGKPDWTLGEDNGKKLLVLRNMQDPTATQQPQPKNYRAAYWLDPNSSADYGNVHTNSGVGNFCFYSFCMKTSVQTGIVTFVNALRTLKTTSNYLDFRDALKRSAGVLIDQMQHALNDAGLTDTIVNDWTKVGLSIVNQPLTPFDAIKTITHDQSQEEDEEEGEEERPLKMAKTGEESKIAS